MRCLIIDNYDSFTWNLADYVAQIFGTEPLVVRNDQHCWEEIKEYGAFGSIIISPGPGSVTNPADFNMSRQALEQDEIPVLGVCLGFQGLAHIYGGEIRHAPEPYHGRKSRIYHYGSDLFTGIPRTFEAVRYHSLIVATESLPPQLQATARTECGLLMAIRHSTLPKWGVQFHPESILTSYGKHIITNFRDLAHRHIGREAPVPKVSVPGGASKMGRTDARQLKVYSRRLTDTLVEESVFLKLFARKKNAFWLDSQGVEGEMARFSFMGCAEDDATISFKVSGDSARAHGQEHLAKLEQELESAVVYSGEELPFEFRGGYVGFMSYEMKTVFGANTSHVNRIPDSMWMRVDRFVAFDHVAGQVILVAISGSDECEVVARWMNDITQELGNAGCAERRPRSLGNGSMCVKMNLGRDAYLEAIGQCKKKIVEGESYEVCLTNGFSIDVELDPLDLYLVMRRENAAPFGAFIRTGGASVISTSPERFLKVDATGCVQSKPIKGTCARADTQKADQANALRLRASEKDQAENLMIVDLMRNDLGRVSVPGSVRVPKLMDIESFKTVHQMVSTVESMLKPECTLFDLLRAVFPGGSITGAPKIRTMEIIDQIESGPRGVYCGTIGYLGYNRIADLNVAIRSLSYDGHTARFGAGGAVTFLSDPNGEFEEVLLKAEALLRPIWHYLSQSDNPLAYSLVGDHLILEETAAAQRAILYT
ncbi:MAG: aminodeoxychorismate synthase component I [Gammaproteobacteria bacterium]|nr:aminodeoxychorismate synthase component I [Gammaproteobacteria bacterium]